MPKGARQATRVITVDRLLKRLEWEKRRRLQRLFMSRLRERGISVGQGASVTRGCHLAPSLESIGEGTRIHRNCVIKGRVPISIGSYCEIAEGVHMISSNHDMTRPNLNVAVQLSAGSGSLLASRGPIRIGNNVWIGDNAIVLSGVTVGDGAVIGAGSIVTESVEPFSIVVGVPARLIRKRFDDDTIERLLAISWWDWPVERIRENGEFLGLDLTTADAANLLRELD